MSATFSINVIHTSDSTFIYPNGDVSNATHLLRSGGGNGANFVAIDEPKTSFDDDSSYVYTDYATHGNSVASDLYTLGGYGDANGTVNNVKVYVRSKSHNNSPDSTATFKILTKVGSFATASSDNFNLTTDYTYYTQTYTSQPSDSSSWSWNAIDNLQVGVNCSSPTNTLTGLSETLRPNASGGSTNLVLMHLVVVLILLLLVIPIIGNVSMRI
jgi:hypothetical protein